MSRLVEYLEYGWDLALRCSACGHADRWSRDKFLSRPAWLNAEVGDLVARLYCSECKAREIIESTVNGGHGPAGMAHQGTENRAVHIRRVLTSAGLDPAAYGYPPIR